MTDHPSTELVLDAVGTEIVTQGPARAWSTGRKMIWARGPLNQQSL